MNSTFHTGDEQEANDTPGKAQGMEASADSGKTPLKIDYLNVKKSALVLRALNHRLRQQMIQVLDAQGKMTVTELYVQLRLEQSVASQHLAILRRAGIVRTEREGKFVYYRIDPDRVATINACVERLIS